MPAHHYACCCPGPGGDPCEVCDWVIDQTSVTLEEEVIHVSKFHSLITGSGGSPTCPPALGCEFGCVLFPNAPPPPFLLSEQRDLVYVELSQTFPASLPLVDCVQSYPGAPVGSFTAVFSGEVMRRVGEIPTLLQDFGSSTTCCEFGAPFLTQATVFATLLGNNTVAWGIVYGPQAYTTFGSGPTSAFCDGFKRGVINPDSIPQLSKSDPCSGGFSQNQFAFGPLDDDFGDFDQSDCVIVVNEDMDDPPTAPHVCEVRATLSRAFQKVTVSP